MTITRWVLLIVGTLAAGLACVIARLSGNFWMQLHRLDAAAYCSEPFLDIQRRWLYYYIPVIALTVVGAGLMPHWVFAIALAAIVVWAFKTGQRQAYATAVDRQTSYYVREGEAAENAKALAKRDVDAVISVAKMRLGLR